MISGLRGSNGPRSFLGSSGTPLAHSLLIYYLCQQFHTKNNLNELVVDDSFVFVFVFLFEAFLNGESALDDIGNFSICCPFQVLNVMILNLLYYVYLERALTLSMRTIMASYVISFYELLQDTRCQIDQEERVYSTQ